MEIMTFSATAVLLGWALVQKLAFLCVKIFLHSEKMPFLHHRSCIQRAIASLSSQGYLLLWLDNVSVPAWLLRKKHCCVFCHRLGFHSNVPCPTHMLSAGFYLEIFLQLSVHSALASSLARLMLQSYAGVRSHIFRYVTFSVGAFFSLCPPSSPLGLGCMGGGRAFPRAECRNLGDLRTDG